MTIRSLGEWTPQVAEDVFVAPSAEVLGQVIMEAGSSVWYGCVLRGDLVPIHVGELSNIQDLSVLHTGWDEPTWIGRGVTVGHQATIHGARIEDYCLIGIGAKILNRAVVGPESIVGAGSLVPEGKTVPPGVLVMGTPFRVVRDLSAAEKEGLRAHAERYARMARHHAQWLAAAKD